MSQKKYTLINPDPNMSRTIFRNLLISGRENLKREGILNTNLTDTEVFNLLNKIGSIGQKIEEQLITSLFMRYCELLNPKSFYFLAESDGEPSDSLILEFRSPTAYIQLSTGELEAISNVIKYPIQVKQLFDYKDLTTKTALQDTSMNNSLKDKLFADLSSILSKKEYTETILVIFFRTSGKVVDLVEFSNFINNINKYNIKGIYFLIPGIISTHLKVSKIPGHIIANMISGDFKEFNI